MPTKIQFKRGLNANIAATQLSAGEPAFATDTGKLYIGDETNKVLINPMDKPSGLDTTNEYTKLKVNEYGQVVQQSNLVATDIPPIPYTQVSGLGTCATINTGNTSGTIPTLDATGKFPFATMPIKTKYAHFYFEQGTGSWSTNPGYFLNLNTVWPPDAISGTNPPFTLNADNTVTLNLAGVYFVSYNVTSGININPTGTATTALSSPNGGGVLTGTISRSTSSSTNPYYNCRASTARLFNALDKVGILNYGSEPITLNNMSGSSYNCSLSITKISYD